MRNNALVRFASVTAMTALLSALLSAPVLAQEAAESEEAVTVTETDTTDDPTSEQSDPQAAVDSGAVLDYEPTESISEDLSVSFPVDI
jgi:hypothetical protein